MTKKCLYILGTSLLEVFDNFSSKLNVTPSNDYKFDWLCSFGMVKSINTSYYITDYDHNRIFILNEDWTIVSFKDYKFSRYIVAVKDNLYIVGDESIYKTNSKLELLGNITSRDSYYTGIYSTDSLIYVTSIKLNISIEIEMSIKIFDLNLVAYDSITTTPYKPWSISGYNDVLFIGTAEGIICKIVDKIIISSFNGCNGNEFEINSILFDHFGYMATLCNKDDKMYLFESNSTVSIRSMSTSIDPFDIGFDSKGRFVVVSSKQISLYF